MSTTTLISIVVFLQLMICFMLVSQNKELGDIVQQQRRLLVIDLCHVKHATATNDLVQRFITGTVIFPDFEAAWSAERNAYQKACLAAA